MEAAHNVRDYFMNTEITIKKCNLDDVTKLALLNKQLIDDEKSNNTMTIKELEDRMKEFISTEYDAYYFLVNETVIGYALVKNSCNPFYLRQFLIDRQFRKMHYGTVAFHTLLDYLKTAHIDIEVLPWNETGIRFWNSLGFHEISRYMRL